MPFRFECKTCDMKFQVQADYQKHIQKCGSMFTEMTPNELNPKSRSKKKKLPKTEGWFLIHQNHLSVLDISKTQKEISNSIHQDSVSIEAFGLNDVILASAVSSSITSGFEADDSLEPDVNQSNRITELQPVQVSVGISGAVHSISKECLK